MRIPESKIEEVRASADIVDTISRYVQLKKAGANYKGICPFHSEKTPSFVVSPQKQIYHCFGCAAGGNVFKFLMEYNKISFVEAVQELAEENGIAIEYEQRQKTEEQSEAEKMYDINLAAAKFFSDKLLKTDNPAKNYLEKRNIKLKTMRAFGLGYNPSGWSHLVDFLSSKSFNLERAQTLGLIGKGDRGDYYDKYHGRLIFPIFSPNGRVIAFAGRTLEKDGIPKYVNSPESILYNKSRVLYGLSHGKDDIRRKDAAIIVEGYMDLISLYQAGVKNVVAVSGTALTKEQVQLLSRYTKNVFLLFDADEAGVRASIRSIEQLLKQNMNIKITSLPEGEDPDSFIHKHDKEDFEKELDKAVNFLEFQTEVYRKEGKFDDPDEMTAAIRELISPVALIDDELKREMLIRSISEKFDIREKLLEVELAKEVERTSRNEIRTEQRESRTRRELKEKEKPERPEKERPSDSVIRNEKELIRLLLEGDEEIIEFIFNSIDTEEIQAEAHKVIAERIEELWETDKDLTAGSVVDHFTDERLTEYIMKLTFEKYQLSERILDRSPLQDPNTLLRLAVDTVKKFRQIRVDEKIGKLLEEMETAEYDETKKSILRQIDELYAEKRIIYEEYLKILGELKLK